MTACKLQYLGASFETNIVLGEPERCQKRTKIPPRDFEEALICVFFVLSMSVVNQHPLFDEIADSSKLLECQEQWLQL